MGQRKREIAQIIHIEHEMISAINASQVRVQIIFVFVPLHVILNRDSPFDGNKSYRIQ